MTARRSVLDTLMKVTEEGAFANLAVKEGLSDVRPNELGRSTALLYTTLEHISYCDFLISHYAKGRIQPKICGILRLGIAELFFMDTPDHAVCNESVKLACEIGKSQLKGFVNGVLRSILRDKQAGTLPQLPFDDAERLAVETGYPLFFIREHISLYGKEAAEAFFKAPLCKSCVRAVWPDSLGDIAGELAVFGASNCDITPDDACFVDSFEGLTDNKLFKEGRIAVQSPGAMLACKCLAPKAGMKVLDCCAAPGGKTGYVFDLMQRRGSIIAWDLHPHRVGLINSTLERLRIPLITVDEALSGAYGVAACVRDASAHDDGLDEHFDAVLCDVPCSGLGGGGKPDARLRRTEDGVGELAALQLKILSQCSRYLKLGGALVYSTCTVSQRENEGVVTAFLKDNGDFVLSSLEDCLPDKLRERGKCGMLTLMPNVDGTDGFFIAKFTRTK